MFLGDISKACNEKLFWLIRYIPFGGKVQSRNYGPNSFPIAYKNKFKIAKSAVLSKFWVAACQLKYFNTSLIFDLISIPISLLDLNNSAATQSDRGQVWDIMNMRRMHFCFTIFTVKHSAAVKCVKYHEYEDDAKYLLKWFTFQPVSPSYCSPDPVTGNLPFDCIDIIDVRESYRFVRDFCHLFNEIKLCWIFKCFRFGFHQTLRDSGGKYMTSFESNWTIEIFRNNFVKDRLNKSIDQLLLLFSREWWVFWGQIWTVSSRSKISTYVHSWP